MMHGSVALFFFFKKKSRLFIPFFNSSNNVIILESKVLVSKIHIEVYFTHKKDVIEQTWYYL